MSRRRNLHTRVMVQEIRAGRIKEGATVDQWRSSFSIFPKGKRPKRQTKQGEPGVRLGYRATIRWRNGDSSVARLLR